MKRILLLLFFVSLTWTGCNDDSATALLDQQVNHQLVGKGNLYGNNSENIGQQNMVINTQAEWDALKAAMNTTNNATQGFGDVAIDFDLYQVIAVFEEVKMNGGWTIDVTDISETPQSLTVNLENNRTGNATTVITQPFEIVKIKRTTKPILFE